MRINTAEVIALTFTAWWAIRLLVPDHPFASVPQVYDNMAGIAPEWAWAAGLGAICGLHFLAFALNNLWMRRAALMAIACFWGLLTAIFLIGSPHGVIWGSHAITAAITAWAFGMTYEQDGEHT
jgi:hypothetical protein